MSGTWMLRAASLSRMCGTAAAASSRSTVMRTSSEPARASAATWATVESTSAVSVLVIDCTTTGAPPPTCTVPTMTGTVSCRGSGCGEIVGHRLHTRCREPPPWGRSKCAKAFREGVRRDPIPKTASRFWPSAQREGWEPGAAARQIRQAPEPTIGRSHDGSAPRRSCFRGGPAAGAEAAHFQHVLARQEAAAARLGVDQAAERLRRGLRRGAAPVADEEERGARRAVVAAVAGDVGVLRFDAVGEIVLDQEIERPVDRDRRRAVAGRASRSITS